MRPSQRFLIPTALLTIALAAPNYAEDFIRVGSFNIANFGASPNIALERSLVSLVNIMRQMDADLIAIQEVQPTDLGSAQVVRLRELLNRAAEFDGKKPYDFIIASDHTGDETTAFLCADNTPLVLRPHLSPNPISCARCNMEVPPERIGFDATLAEALASWQSFHECFYLLWLDSDEFEQWAAAQLLDPSSTVNTRSLELAVQLSDFWRCSLWWFTSR